MKKNTKLAQKSQKQMEKKMREEMARRKKLFKIPLIIFSGAVAIILVYRFLLAPAFSNFDLSHFASLQAGGTSVSGDLSVLEPYPFQLTRNIPSFVYLGSGTCYPCKMMAPILEELQEDLKGKANVINIDLGKYRSAGDDFGIRSIPTLVFYDKQGNEKNRRIGFTPKNEVIKELRNLGMRN